jgi:pSer/pThr/pTyr-binding forkhead associated (FHA) protein
MKTNMTRLYQIGEDGSQAGQWDIREEPLLVGRSSQAQIRLEDEGVSRRHFLIVRDGGDCVIKDLNSRNGTWVDGYRVFAEKLRHNDSILAGRTVFVFADREDPLLLHHPLRGPHGTVVLSATGEADPDPSATIPGLVMAGGPSLVAAA